MLNFFALIMIVPPPDCTAVSFALIRGEEGAAGYYSPRPLGNIF